ncbi:MAG: glycerol-3-phosphate dehydrogenase [Myxococcales bacterium SG8_38]|nr:MAG: glycerol-3-phosphate dehydrogenase [Myxococcales bacterium SG8_38]
MGELKTAVLGAGSWGTALAKLLADQGHQTRLWARRAAMAESLQSERANQAYLPGFTLPDTLEATSDLEYALAGAELVVCVIPTHGLRQALRDAVPFLGSSAPIVSATKGIEIDSLMLVSELFEDVLPETEHRRLAYLGGPSFAKEVAAGLPTAVSVAARDPEVASMAQEAFTTGRFRVYRTDDVVGVELGGALKNVVAIAAGIADGLGFGHNTRAGLITRGLAEISRLALAKGANPLTLAGLSGMGDLVLTCTGDLSRNRNVGLQIGRGKKLQDILGSMQMVAEGVRTTKSANALAERVGVDMPITHEVYAMLYEDKSPLKAVGDLMTRPLRDERE